MVHSPNNEGDSDVLSNPILKVQQQQEQMMQNLNDMMKQQNQMFDQFKDVVHQLQQVLQSLIPVQNKPTTTQHIPEAAPSQQLILAPQPVSTHQSPSRHRSRSPRESRSSRRSRTSGESPSSQSTSTLQPITPPRQLGAQRTAQSPVAVVRPLRPGSENVDAARGGHAANTGGNNRGRVAQTGGNNRGRPSYRTRYVWYGP